MSDQELLTRADQCLERAGSALEPRPAGLDHEARLYLFLEAQSCLDEVARRQTERTADEDRKRGEEIANRDFWMEVGVMVLIGIEIILSVYGLWEGHQQAKILEKQTTALTHMDTSTAATAESLQKLVIAQDESLKIFQQDQAERAKKPKLALFVGSVPLDKATIQLKRQEGSAQDGASFDLVLKNLGEAPLSTFRLHIFVPGDVVFNSDPLFTVPEYEPSANPDSRRITLQLPLSPAGQTVHIHCEIYSLKGHAGFKIPFTVDALELQAVSALGSLTVLPPESPK